MRAAFSSAYEDYQGWLVAGLVGILTALVAFFVDYAESSFGDLKFGMCKRNPLFGREACCFPREVCPSWEPWSTDYSTSFAIYAGVAWVLAMGAGLVTKLTREEIPAFASHDGGDAVWHEEGGRAPKKVIYMAAGSGIPEIKLLLSGFEFPNLLSAKVLVVKAVGAALAVASGLCLGKEGPFVHIATSAGYVVARRFPQFRDNGRSLREMLSVACSSALAVAFGSPIGGVLFVYEVGFPSSPPRVVVMVMLTDPGNEQPFPAQGALEGLPVLHDCGHDAQVARPHANGQAGPVRDQLWGGVQAAQLPLLRVAGDMRRSVWRHVLQRQSALDADHEDVYRSPPPR